METMTNIDRHNSHWKSLYRIGGAAALLAALVFRRNLGAEINLFTQQPLPETVLDWFTLLQDRPLIGLSYLNLFDLLDYVLVALMFLAVYAAFRNTHRSAALVALTLGLVGMAVSLASNASLSMLSLSSQYAAAANEAQRSLILAAGQAMLAVSSQPGVIYHSTGMYSSYLFIAIAGFIFSLLMLKSHIFGRAAAYTGILAGALDLVYCIGIIFLPLTKIDLIAKITQPAAGLLLMVWHFLIGLKLWRLAPGASQKEPLRG